MRYNGMYLPLDFCKNKYNCSILDFLALLDELINPDYKILAGFVHPVVDKSFITAILLVLLLMYVTYKIIVWVIKK